MAIVKPSDLAIVEEGKRKGRLVSTGYKERGVFNQVSWLKILAFSVIFSVAKIKSRVYLSFFLLIFNGSYLYANHGS